MRRGTAVLVVVAALAALPACGVLGGGDTYTLTAHFPRAVSVFPSGDVRVLGLPAGEVTKVEVEGDTVLVELAISSDVKVPEGARAQIVPQSLIGERYIQLSPAFEEGMDTMQDGDEIEDTIVPVEPDEALAALKEFLDSLDPDGLGALVTNLEEDLRGNGAALNDTLGSFSELVGTFAANDDVLLRIIDSFDQLSATLVTREAQLGEVLDAFAAASDVLADERQSITDLVAGLADLSRTGLRLVGEHSTALRADIQTLADAAATIDANLSSVTSLLTAGNLLTTGLLDAYNPSIRAIDLRNNFSPLILHVVEVLLGVPGLGVCDVIPVLGECPAAAAQSTGTPTPARIAATDATTPVGTLLDLLASESTARHSRRSAVEGLAGWLEDAPSTLLGVGG
jgi:phospholipid/cholesterol/gamma-HCH transport system substrate-binding protein